MSFQKGGTNDVLDKNLKLLSTELLDSFSTKGKTAPAALGAAGAVIV